MKGLYVHVPFCVRKCAYCDFYSLPAPDDLMDAYIDAALRESRASSGMVFDTLYLGGGTPSRLGAERLTRLIHGLRQNLNLAGLVEATIEANPESATVELLQTAKDLGINRASIGVQSLADSELKSVGRIHDAAQAIEAVERAVSLGFGVSADLIIGLPGQAWRTLRDSIKTLVKLGVQHLSMYCLSLEENTPLAASPPEDLPDDDKQAELFELASRLAVENGFAHYEISNFAMPGCECQHNLNYWRGGEYLGLGPGAASHLNGKRFRNRPDLAAYLKEPCGVTEDVDELDIEAKAAEEAMLRLRLLIEGVNADELAGRFGHEALRGLKGRLSQMVASGWLIIDRGSYRLAHDRVLTSNPVFAKVLRDD